MRCLRILTMKLLNRVHNFFLIKFVLIFLWWMVVLFQFFFLTNNTTINILCIKILLFLPCDFWLGFEKCCCWISGKILLLILFYPFGFFFILHIHNRGTFSHNFNNRECCQTFHQSNKWERYYIYKTIIGFVYSKSHIFFLWFVSAYSWLFVH